MGFCPSLDTALGQGSVSEWRGQGRSRLGREPPMNSCAGWAFFRGPESERTPEAGVQAAGETCWGL